MTYRSFLRDPSEDEKFLSNRILGNHEEELRRRLSRLSRKFYCNHPWSHSEAGTVDFLWENPNIPSGYSYLLQFVAHDCVNSSVPTSLLGADGLIPTNLRSAPLTMETLYGMGPDGCAHAIAADENSLRQTSKIGLSRPRLLSHINIQCPYRDVARGTSVVGEFNTGVREVLIPDSRNDNNVLISQMNVLFSLLHNLLVDRLFDACPSPGGSRGRSASRVFFMAKQFCTGTYRRIVKNDLCRRILHPEVFAFYDILSPRFLDTGPARVMPLESVLALRFGHAMVRPNYKVNHLNGHKEELIDVLLNTSRGRPWRLPLDETWLVQWSCFFEIAGGRPNLSRRIGPNISTDLISAQIFEGIDETGAVGLAYRDLITSSMTRPWSLRALINELRHRAPQFIRGSPLLADDEHRRAVLRNWLRADRAITGLQDDDVELFADDPPLILFVLFEAAHQMQGERLGTLGSILVGDFLFRALQDEAEPNGRGHSPGRLNRVADRSNSQAGIGETLSEISDMPGLIQFLGREFEGAEAVLPLV